jgi:hypothetical protein
LIAVLQIDPGMARMIYHACEQGFGVAACTIAGIMSVSSNFYWRGGTAEDKATIDAKHLSFCSEHGDVVSMFDAYSEWESMLLSYLPNPGQDDDNATTSATTVEASVDELADDLMSRLHVGAPSVDDSVLVESDCDDDQSDKGDCKPCAAAARDSEEDLKSEYDDDSVSVMSDLSVQSDRTDSHEIKKVSRFTASKVAKNWCQQNFLNNKSLGMAHSTKNDVLKGLKMFKDGKVWCQRADQSSRPNGVELQRLLFKGLFLNLSMQTPMVREYEVLRNNTPTVGVVHPGSSLAKLANNAPHGQAAQYFPQFVVFHSMLTTNRTYLTVVTPVLESWAREESAEFFHEIVEVQMSKSRCEKVTISPVRLQTIRVILGRYNQHKDALESKLDCSIQYDSVTCTLDVWCTRDAVDATRTFFHSRIQSAQEMALTEVEEEVVLGSTRAIYGAGGLVKCILFAGQFVSINISGLPEDATQDEVQALVMPYGITRLVDVTSSLIRGAVGNKKTVNAHVTFESHLDAARALAGLQGELIRGCCIRISQGGIRNSTQHTSISSQLNLSWAMSPSQCKGVVDLPSAKAANIIIGFCNKGLNCPILQGLGPTVRLRAQIPGGNRSQFLFDEQTHQGPARLTILGLSPHVDEVDIGKAFEDLARYMARSGVIVDQPTRISVRRDVGDISVQDQTTLSVQTAELRMCIPLKDKIQTETSFFDSKFANRAGFYLQYDSSLSTDAAFGAWERCLGEWKATRATRSDGQPVWMMHGQPIRLERKFQSAFNVHTSLWKFFENQFLHEMDQLRVELRVTCKLAKPKADIGKHVIPRTTLQVTASTSPALHAAIARLSDILKNVIFTPRNAAEREILFSAAGRKIMQKISDSVTYLHWVIAATVILY